MTRPIFDHFSFVAPYYDRVIHPGSHQKLLELLALSSQHNVLDAGGGTGRVAQIMQGYVRHVVVADISLGMLREAALKERLLPVNTPIEKLPFGDEAFDRVVMVDALHHVADQAKAARELWRVLKPGGRIVIEEPDIRMPMVKVVALGEKILMMRSHFLPPDRIAGLFDFASAQIHIDEDDNSILIVVKRDT